jgi:hypothetical protein
MMAVETPAACWSVESWILEFVLLTEGKVVVCPLLKAENLFSFVVVLNPCFVVRLVLI